ncbi:hypothetical protein B9T33_03485 [Acinetobacter sp. ANC 5054]|uniref:hypothetical protein n=1 Tax=Acinetobacter sp. ANC 5054 TaxID=1977877 RepID=UPI000A32BF68|nr:hypothetical protein [Acinetobacter sp. ANC 5054]OTG83472.1 hypothetical protein B9T33_03485 [Acinetobacter sp. ANC 5054]
MKTKKNSLKGNTAFGVVVSLLGIACGLWLLISLEKISGAEFVAFSFGFAVIGLIIAFAAEVQEFSIAGNGVKLKELRSEAEKTIEELKEARTELFRLILPQIMQGSQNTLDRIDPRIVSFLHFFDQIKKFELVNELRGEIEHVLHVLLICQYGKLNVIHQSSKTIENSFDELDTPTHLFIALSDENVASFMRFNEQYKNSGLAKKDLIQGIHAYTKLYDIKIQLDKM